MAKVKATGNSSTPKKLRPALTPENRESQLISLAYDQAEEQLMNKTAPSQMVCHFLKLATEQTRLQREKLANENELLRAKTEAIQSAQRVEELYANAIEAMRRYGGQGGSEYDDEDYY